ncbi:23587_t:CDS:2 [Gigaspora margarita]|uniref:23587_t:CDS:1 n=1 Tax=Gigaspora margarita TaxID=4874 RepID=A0ABM8VZ31_GIGMA|nr:23587_t:CDS:2 [Gigaspora margarita]
MQSLNELLEKYRQHAQNTGSTEYQLILLREQIAKEKNHLANNRKDIPAKRALLKKIARQKKYFSYLKKRSPQVYEDIKKLSSPAIKATIAKTSVAKTSPAVIKSLPAVSSTACNLPARITEDEIRISKLFQSFDFPEFLHYFSMAVEMEKSSPPIRLNLPIPPKSSLPSFDSSSNNIMRVVGETATKTQTVASSSLFENILPSLKNTTSEGRRVYDFSAEIEGIKINELMIDPHYEEKHGSYINDGKIFSIVKEFLKTKAYWPSRNLRISWDELVEIHKKHRKLEDEERLCNRCLAAYITILCSKKTLNKNHLPNIITFEILSVMWEKMPSSLRKEHFDILEKEYGIDYGDYEKEGSKIVLPNEFKKSGRDIVCAAISAITNGTINFLFAYYSNACQIICQPTKITIYPNTDNLDCQLCLRLMLYQLKNVANHYPRYLKIREEKTLTEENLGGAGGVEKLFRPVQCRLITKKKKSLLGETYCFWELQSQKITSPLIGTVTKIFPNHSLHITGKGGVQIILTLHLATTDFPTPKNLFRQEVKAGQKVKFDTVLFTLYQPEKIDRVIIHLLWQPHILKKIEVNKNRSLSFLLKLHYRKPFEK